MDIFAVFLVNNSSFDEIACVLLLGGSVDTFEKMVAAQLDKVLSSDGFVNAPQLQNFLLYIVNRHIQKKSDRIDAYAIATQALGRPVDFAPDLDPIVRVQAANLRQRLNLYNASTGAEDPIQITLPKGGYTPVIEDMRIGLGDKNKPNSVSTISEVNQSSTLLPSIIVNMIKCDGSPKLQKFSECLHAGLVMALNQFDEVNVIPSRSKESQYLGEKNSYLYKLYGNCRPEGGRVELDVFLVNIGNGICIYSRQFDVNLEEDMAAAKKTVVSEVSSSIAELSGAIFADIVVKNSEIGIQHNDAMGSIVRSYQFSYSPNEEKFIEAKELLERTLDHHPDFVLALCRLGFVFLDAFYFMIGGEEHSLKYLQAAKKISSMVLELSPRSCLVNLLKSEVLFATGRDEDAKISGDFAIELNPENHQVAAFHGFRRVTHGHISSGIELVRSAKVKGHFLPERLLMAEICLCVFESDYQAVHEYCSQINLPNFFMFHVFAAGAHYQTGNKRESKKSLQRSLKLRPGLSLDDIWKINMRTSSKEFAEATRKLIKNVGYP